MFAVVSRRRQTCMCVHNLPVGRGTFSVSNVSNVRTASILVTKTVGHFGPVENSSCSGSAAVEYSTRRVSYSEIK